MSFLYIPSSLIENQKKGFGLPINSLLKNELKDWSLSLLSKKSLEKSGFLNTNIITELVNKYFAGNLENSNQIWNLLMFQNWYNKN